MKAAVIGLGGIGKLHMSVLKQLGISITCLCDIDPATAEAARKEFAPDARVFTDWRQMLLCRPDVVHICTPHYLHCEMICEALEQNIHVLCEKPLCMRPEEIDAVLDAEKRSTAILGVCHQNRYNPAVRFTQAFLQDHEILAAHGSLTWHRDASYYGQDDWHGKLEKEGGGVLINQALHTLDLMQMLCGTPEKVNASVQNLSLKGIIEVEDTVSAIYHGTVPFTFYASNTAFCDMPAQITFRLSGGSNLILLPHSVFYGGQVLFDEPVLSHRFGKPCYGNSHESLIWDFYAHAARHAVFPINGSEAAKVMKMIFSAYTSHGSIQSI